MKPTGAGARPPLTLLCALAALTMAACGDDGTGPESEGRIEAFVGDDPQQSAAAEALPTAPAGAANAFSGQASGDFRASIRSEGGAWVDLGSLNGITVQLQQTGSGTTVHGAQTVAAGTYTRVRLTLSDVRVSLQGGSDIGGLVLQGDAELALGGSGETVIERDVTLTVGASTIAVLRFDLNAEDWLTPAAVQAGAVSEASVRSAVGASAGTF